MGDIGGLTEVDFEIALTAFLASTVSVFPSPTIPEYPVIQSSAIGLLLLTLFRRLAVINDIDRNSRLLEASTHLLHLFTYVSLLYIFYVGTRWLATINWMPLPRDVLFLCVVPIGALSIILFQEVALKDTLSGSEQLFTGVSDKHRGTVFGGLFGVLSVFLGKKRQAFHRQTRQSNLGEFYERDVGEMSEEELENRALSTLKAGTIILLGLLWYMGIIIGGSIAFNVQWYVALSLLIGLMLVTGLVDMWYSNYGVLGVGDRNGFIHALVVVVAFLFTARLVFL